MGAGASLHNNNNNNHHLLENVKNMDAKELSKFARKNKINTFVRETIKLNDIDGKTAIELDDDIIQDMADNKLNQKKLMVALHLLKDAVKPSLDNDNIINDGNNDTNLMDYFASTNNTKSNNDNIVEDILSITIVSAKNLKKTDGLFSNQSGDPYVKIFFNNKNVGETKVINKSSNPTWQETITLHVPHDVDFTNITLSFKIYDHDTISAHDFLGQIKLIGDEIHEALRKCEFNDHGKPLVYHLTGEDGKTSDSSKVSGTLSFRLNIDTPDDDNNQKSNSMVRNASRLSNRSMLNSRGSLYSSSVFSRNNSRMALRSRGNSRHSMYSSLSGSTTSFSRNDWYDGDIGKLRTFTDIQEFINSIDGVDIQTDLTRTLRNVQVKTVEHFANMMPEEKAKIIGSKLKSITDVNNGIGKIKDLKRALRWSSLLEYVNKQKKRFKQNEIDWIIKEYQSRDDEEDMYKFGKEIERRCNIQSIIEKLDKRELRQWKKYRILQKAKQYVNMKSAEIKIENQIVKENLDKSLSEIEKQASRVKFVDDWLDTLQLSAIGPLVKMIHAHGYHEEDPIEEFCTITNEDMLKLLDDVKFSKIYMANDANDFEKIRSGLYGINRHLRKIIFDLEMAEKRKLMNEKKKQVLINAYNTLEECIGFQEASKLGQVNEMMDYGSMRDSFKKNETKMLNLNGLVFERENDQDYTKHIYDKIVYVESWVRSRGWEYNEDNEDQYCEEMEKEGYIIESKDVGGETISVGKKSYQYDKNGKHFKRQAADTDRFKKKKLDDDAAKALAVILGINGSVPPPPGVPSGIEILYLNENRVGDEGAIAIGKALLRNKESNLKKIYMYNNLMTMKGEQFLRKVADRKKGLTIHGINVAKQRDSYSVMKSNFIGKGEKNYGVYMSMGTM